MRQLERSTSKQTINQHYTLLVTLSLFGFKTIMAKMRAILIKDGKGPIENLYVGETVVPSLKSQEVLVKARTAP